MNEFKRIVAATDLSDCSAAALPYAKTIAKKFDAELTVLHANVLAPLIEGVPTNLAYAAAYQLLAPLASALLGYRFGDIVSWQMPGGVRRLKIDEIIYQPEAAGDFHL